jgi:hypothetical protein
MPPALTLRGIERNGPNNFDTLSLELKARSGDVTTIAEGVKRAVPTRNEFASGQRVG